MRVLVQLVSRLAGFPHAPEAIAAATEVKMGPAELLEIDDVHFPPNEGEEMLVTFRVRVRTVIEA